MYLSKNDIEMLAYSYKLDAHVWIIANTVSIKIHKGNVINRIRFIKDIERNKPFGMYISYAKDQYIVDHMKFWESHIMHRKVCSHEPKRIT